MSDDWFSSMLVPERENHPEEVGAIKDYLRQKTTAPEAAQAITRPVMDAEDPDGDIYRLYGLLRDALLELRDHTEPLLALLQAIEDLPQPDFTAAQPTKRYSLWKGLSCFGHEWYDVSYRSGSWKSDAEKTSGSERYVLQDEHARTAEVEARLFMAGLAGIPIDWGYKVIEEALGKDSLLDFQIPAAAE
ncbi:hypothetical protein P3342_001363 [Pyrenophora teres f. teres]|uniref:DUF3632 domain containing protein n=1 Tax=Pyrenophora teres f. teres TaxID=97479 RepID=A0A6S6VAW5_9PLEO|nr:hypothetical protein HRS9139_10113 [Pyrenophora teres f. teres]KAE8826099.1 hypothetical protein PTNB85_09044 [Pyrenophora teres f. teres]KAE8832892.1 hypothetical protein HRS9122_08605 [Pyrenophora teres f. teres]KAE8852842.1 hypothetical protein PTNB29_10232 [Pyrenophora teres f. teres]KAE8856441.1 hypothetical protein PTNB73_09706 [Pyrenophora teres f. teres]